MKSVVVFLVAFIVATAGAAGVKVLLTKPVPASASDSTATRKDSTHTDSTRTDTAIVASKAAGTAADSAHPIAPADSPKVVATSVPMPTAIQPVKSVNLAAKVAAATAAAATSDTAVITSERRVAKVFTSMEAKQAAKVLEHMADEDVHIILGYVGPRQAASIMASLPPERVAKLSKLAMQGKK